MNLTTERAMKKNQVLPSFFSSAWSAQLKLYFRENDLYCGKCNIFKTNKESGYTRKLL